MVVGTIPTGDTVRRYCHRGEQGVGALDRRCAIYLIITAESPGQGIAAGARYWVLYGLGAIARPLVTGHVGDRWGFGPALRTAFLIEAAAVLLPTVSTAPVSLIVSSVVVGSFTPGIVPLVLGRIHELVSHSTERRRATWSHATTSFALFQAGAAYGFSWLYAHTGGDDLVLFGLGGGAVVLALAIDLVLALTIRKAEL
jgi:predicted MFS family arabinose efflux permease